MENFSRCHSSREVSMQMGKHNAGGPTGMHDLRSYSTRSYASSLSAQNTPQRHYATNKTAMKTKRNKSRAASSSSLKSWSFINIDSELQRKKRVASYKVYSVEGKMKGSLKKSFRWIKDTCNHVVHGWW